MASPRSSPTRRQLLDDPEPHVPLVGALLRFGHARAHAAVLTGLAAAGYGDITTAHIRVLRFPAPDGERPSDLAARAGMTKQAMNYLLGQLDELGYLTREGGRVSLTERGWRVAALQRKLMRALEATMAREVGAADFAIFMRVLRTITQPAAQPAQPAQRP